VLRLPVEELLLATLERVGVARQLLDSIRARAADVAAAPPGEQFVAAVFAFAEAVDGARIRSASPVTRPRVEVVRQQTSSTVSPRQPACRPPLLTRR
jgi:hypothetical protein